MPLIINSSSLHRKISYFTGKILWFLCQRGSIHFKQRMRTPFPHFKKPIRTIRFKPFQILIQWSKRTSPFTTFLPCNMNKSGSSPFLVGKSTDFLQIGCKVHNWSNHILTNIGSLTIIAIQLKLIHNHYLSWIHSWIWSMVKLHFLEEITST